MGWKYFLVPRIPVKSYEETTHLAFAARRRCDAVSGCMLNDMPCVLSSATSNLDRLSSSTCAIYSDFD